MLCGFSEDEALSYRVWDPKTRRVLDSRNVTFIETPPHPITQPTRLSPLWELPPAEFVDDYASTDDLLRDARDYTAVLDFNVNIPGEHANADSVDGGPEMEPTLEQIRDVTRKDLLIPPGESSSGGASSVETLPGGTLPETSSPSSTPDPMPACDQAAPAPSPAPSPAPLEAALRRTARPAPRSKPALMRAHAASTSPRRQTRSGTASLAELFEQRTPHNSRSLALYTNVETQDIAHHLENASLFSKCAYVSTTSAGNHSGGKQTEDPEHFQEGYEPLPSGAMEGGGRQEDHQPQEARCQRVGTCILRPCWTKGGWLTLGQRDQGGRPLQKSSGSAGMGPGTWDRLWRYLRTLL